MLNIVYSEIEARLIDKLKTNFSVSGLPKLADVDIWNNQVNEIEREDHLSEEAAAQAAGLGIWRGGAKPTTPWEYRADRWERAAAASPRAGCPIKGNISQDGEQIYHTPWSPWYGRTQINESQGERWFCDENEAAAAGWRPARPR